jgi:hypothetical protein
MKRLRRPVLPLVLSTILAMPAFPGGSAAEPDGGKNHCRSAERPAPRLILLSLQLARARNEALKVLFYKSVMRQQRSGGRDVSGDGSRRRGPGRLISGGVPPSGR